MIRVGFAPIKKINPVLAIAVLCLVIIHGPAQAQCTATTCPATVVSTGCGYATLPATSGSTGSVSCPGGCYGTIFGTCSSGTYSSGIIQAPVRCPPAAVSTRCGATTLPELINGLTVSVGCPGGCGGTVNGTCTSSGTFTVNDGCLGPCGATVCYTCDGLGNCVNNFSGPYADPTCLGACAISPPPY